MTPLQLYFSYKAAFTNMQVSTFPCLANFPASDPAIAVESLHHLLLLWDNIAGLYLPHVLLVSSSFLMTPSECEMTYDCSMRYSRMLEESSFANRKADYFWMLLLSALMLLVSLSASVEAWDARPHESRLGLTKCPLPFPIFP